MQPRKLHSSIWRVLIKPSLWFSFFYLLFVSKGNLLDFIMFRLSSLAIYWPFLCVANHMQKGAFCVPFIIPFRLTWLMHGIIIYMVAQWTCSPRTVLTQLWVDSLYDLMPQREKVYLVTCEPSEDSITKTCLYNFDPLKPHFYIANLGFTGVYIIILISAQKHRLWVLVRTASSRRF